MERRINVRAAHASADDDEMARIVTAANPDWPLTGAEMAATAQRRGARFHRKFVVEDQPDRLTAFGFIEVPDVAAAPGRLRVRLTVDPARAGRGIGAALYARLESEARHHGATELFAEVLDSHPRALRFACDRGYVVYNRRIESRLALDKVQAESIARGIDAHTDTLFATGVRIASYRQLALAGDGATRRLYELTTQLWQDVPFGIRGDDPTYESFVAEELDDPAFRPAGTLVALDGLQWIGLCAQHARRDHLMTSMTGVVRAWRRRSIARWLKLLSIRYALDEQFSELRTFNDEANTGMLALNRSLGYMPVETDLRLRKELR